MKTMAANPNSKPKSSNLGISPGNNVLNSSSVSNNSSSTLETGSLSKKQSLKANGSPNKVASGTGINYDNHQNTSSKPTSNSTVLPIKRFGSKKSKVFHHNDTTKSNAAERDEISYSTNIIENWESFYEEVILKIQDSSFRQELEYLATFKLN